VTLVIGRQTKQHTLMSVSPFVSPLLTSESATIRYVL